MEHYLYGFTIHSIQGYIFQTNKLKEIAGASELVEQICTTLFAETLKTTTENLKKDDKAIRNAAGNIRYVFNDEAACKKVVLKFPKKILDFAPGVLISQSVVESSDDLNESHFHKLEERLTAQRNSPIRPVDLGYLAVNRSRLSGLPAVEQENSLGEKLVNDRATKLKQDVIDRLKQAKTLSRINLAFFGEKYKGKEKQIPIDVREIVSSKSLDYSWLAVIHADGNNMGQALQNLNNEPTAKENYGQASKKFSEAIDKSTKAAAQVAFQKTNPSDEIKFVPYRPIIVGGDDLIVVCRADLAIDFTNAYLDAFETQTKENLKDFDSLKNGLTACAGIAFIKVNYPFHYAAELAETLCNHAKKIAKAKLDANGLTPSCLMFHKVQDSFVENYNKIIERELTAQASDCRFDFGPYFLAKSPKIDDLLKNVAQFKGKEGNAIKSGLRQWLTDLHYNKAMAQQRMNRLLSVGKEKIITDLGLNNSNGIIADKSPVYDWLTILSINQNNDNDGDN